MIVSRRRMNVSDPTTSAKQEIPAAHEDLGVSWPGSKKPDEKLRRISELEAHMRDMKVALDSCNAKLEEMGIREGDSALKIVELRKKVAVLQEESKQTQQEYEESPATKEFVFDQIKDMHRIVVETNDHVNARIANLRQSMTRQFKQHLTHVDLSKDELDAKFEDKIKKTDAKIDEKIKNTDATIEEGSRYLTKIVHEFGLEIIDIRESIDNIESQMGWRQDRFSEDEGDELKITPHHQRVRPSPRVPSQIVPPNRRPMPPPASTSHNQPLFDLPPDDPSRRPALTARSWTFDALWASMQANLAKSQQLV